MACGAPRQQHGARVPGGGAQGRRPRGAQRPSAMATGRARGHCGGGEHAQEVEEGTWHLSHLLYTYFNRKRSLHINLQHLEILTLIKEKNYPLLPL
jgi:hypothetical protein